MMGGHGYQLTADMLLRKAPASNGGELCLLLVQQNPLMSVDPLELLGDLLGGTPVHKPDPLDAPPATRTVVAPFLMPTPPTIALQGSKAAKDASSDKTVARRLQGSSSEAAPAASYAEDLWVLGAPFLDHFVVILDFQRARLGVAERNGATDEALGAEISRRFNYRNAHSAEAAPVASEDRQSTRHAWGPGAPGGDSHAIHSEASASQGPSSAWAPLAVVSFIFVICGGMLTHFARKLRRRKNMSAPIDIKSLEEASMAPEERDAIAAE
jgi:hypothetical protein